jgi:hypothetical protein
MERRYHFINSLPVIIAWLLLFGLRASKNYAVLRLCSARNSIKIAFQLTFSVFSKG